MKKNNYIKSTFVFLLLFILICDNTAFLINLRSPIEKTRSISEKTINKELIIQPPIVSQALDWVLIPQTNTKFFSPDSSPGIGDSVVYSFAVNEHQNYTLNISAYYDPIDNFAGSIGIGEGIETCAYMMPNGTWLVVGLEIRFDELGSIMHLGIGTNASNLEWRIVGRYNQTDSLAVVGDESGKIRIVFFEMLGLYKSFKGIICFLSDDWGQSWTNRTLMNYTNFSPIAIYGISAAAYKGNFTYAWGGAVHTNKNAKGVYPAENSTIIAVEEKNQSWTLAGNISALGGSLNPRLGCRCPQLFYNRTSDNGTLMMAYDYYLQPGVDHITQRCALVQFENGINSSVIKNWTISFRNNDTGDTPMVYCSKDYSTEIFYFVDHTNIINYHEDGVRNATWGDDDVVSRPLDRFQTESAKSFNIYAMNGPKCFAGWVLNEEGKRVPGILDCKTPFNVRKIQDEVDAYSTKSLTFNGKDQYDNSREARAYSFNLHVGDTLIGFNDLIIFVDETPVSMICTHSYNYISPFISPGSNDMFTVNVSANKLGIATLTISKALPEFGQTIVDKDLSSVKYSTLCGDGVNYYLFFTDVKDEIYRLMFVKTIDGGLSWSDPVLIDSSLSEQYKSKTAIFTGTELYLWTTGTFQYLYYSSDFGKTWIKQILDVEVNSVTSDLICWHFEMYHSGQIIINKSLDYGYIWEKFCIIDYENSSTLSLKEVAYDPVSGNYSFLFSRDNKKEIYFLTAINNGTKASISENILKDGTPLLSEYNEAAHLDLNWIDENSTEWIITTCAKNPISLTNFTSDLAYCISNGSFSFSEWQDFKDINGSSIPTYALPFGDCFDIIFPKYGTPCHVTGVVGEGMTPAKWKITTGSTLIYSISEELDNNYQAKLNFYGITGNGNPLWTTQNLTWACELLDQAGFKEKDSGFLFIDNADPILMESSSLIPDKPNLSKEIEISLTISEENPRNATIYYRTPEMTKYTAVNMSMGHLDASTLSYTGIIPAQTQSITSVSWYVNVSDLCGNTLIIDDNGQNYLYIRPDIRIEEQEEPPEIIDLNEVVNFTVSFIVPEYSDYVDYLYIKYEYDDGEGTHKEHLNATGSFFEYTFENIPTNATILTYKVVAVDIYGNEIELDKERKVNILPKLPSLEMNPELQILISLIALFVGIACSLLYLAVMSSKKSERSLHEELLSASKKKSLKEMPSSRVSEFTSEGKTSDLGRKKKKTTIELTGIGLVAFTVLAILSIIIYQSPEFSMAFLTGAFVVAVTLWVLLSAYTADKTLRSPEEISTKRAKFGLIGMSFAIYIILLGIFFAGNMITWWRVRINQQAYTLAGIIIPKALTSVTSAFFSSILLLTASTFKQITTKTKELKKAQLNNDNPLSVMERRENAVSTVVNNVGQKGIIFTAIIAVVIVFASDLDFYANQAISMVIPFMIGAIATLLLATYFKKKKEAPAETIVLDDIIFCPECKSQTALGANYCENCGKEMLHGRRFSAGIQCNNCKKPNAQGTKHCRYCGTSLEPERDNISQNGTKIN